MSQAMQPMRIGQFTDIYPPIINGASSFLGKRHPQWLPTGPESLHVNFG